MLKRDAIAELVCDQPGEDFTVDRRIFTAEDIFDAEMKAVFEGTWIFIGLETQLPQPHSFFTTHIGRQPVLVMRDAGGKIGCFYNSCRHRGMLVCLSKQGQKPVHVCRYHNWAYDSSGKNRNVTFEKEGAYGSAFADCNHDLVPVAKFDSYRGMLFASVSPDVPTLVEHLGDAAVFLDLIIDQSPTGELELVPGSASYLFEGNWKLQFENGLDSHHFPAVHASYIDIMAKRAEQGAVRNMIPDDDGDAQGTFLFKYGHAVSWRSYKSGDPWGKPLSQDADFLDAVRSRVGSVRAKWMLRRRNLTIFPNLQIVEVQTTQLRTWRPLSAGRTEMSAHCLSVAGEPVEARRFRMRGYEDFFDSTGIASSDDNLMYELSQAGYAAEAAGRTQGYQRGMGIPAETADKFAEELGIRLAGGIVSPGGRTDPEIAMHAGYREWQRLLAAGAGE